MRADILLNFLMVIVLVVVLRIVVLMYIPPVPEKFLVSRAKSADPHQSVDKVTSLKKGLVDLERAFATTPEGIAAWKEPQLGQSKGPRPFVNSPHAAVPFRP